MYSRYLKTRKKDTILFISTNFSKKVLYLLKKKICFRLSRLYKLWFFFVKIIIGTLNHYATVVLSTTSTILVPRSVNETFLFLFLFLFKKSFAFKGTPSKGDSVQRGLCPKGTLSKGDSVQRDCVPFPFPFQGDSVQRGLCPKKSFAFFYSLESVEVSVEESQP